jgi:hypothetical protein
VAWQNLREDLDDLFSQFSDAVNETVEVLNSKRSFWLAWNRDYMRDRRKCPQFRAEEKARLNEARKGRRKEETARVLEWRRNNPEKYLELRKREYARRREKRNPTGPKSNQGAASQT